MTFLAMDDGASILRSAFAAAARQASRRTVARQAHWGQVVGNDFDSTFSWAHGFLWKDGVMTDLNTLIRADSNLFIISASNINDRGQISGIATVQAGPHANEIQAYLLPPSDERIRASMADFARTHAHSILPSNACNHFSQRFGPGRLQR